MNMDQMIEQFNTIEELKAFATSQFRTILEQSKSISKLEEEIEHLKRLLENSAPILEKNNTHLEIIQNLTDEEAVCVMELRRLKEQSLRQELTTEEAKRFDIYTKTLISLRTKVTKQEEDKIRKMDDSDLLKFAEDFNPNTDSLN